jgi:hypothetical protein
MANSISGSSADKFELDPLWQNLDWYVALLLIFCGCPSILSIGFSDAAVVAVSFGCLEASTCDWLASRNDYD